MLDISNSTMVIEPLKVLDTEIGEIKIYDNLIIMEGKEDSLFSFRTGIFILLNLISQVGIRPVVYISNRVNNYSVDPNDYKYLEMIPNLKGIAVVSYSDWAKNAAKLEKRFYKKPFETFGSLDEAKEWASSLLE
ncbi:SpoIIAA family protein [Ulvibacter antarcticus]|uniref:SpoIIAA-like protein n=1 Tax=Ulvibacter antarcticus TaxID=442714 RepID=A0A3L9YI72_9FLAO|nr:STAS/SEC14 domain-containing protein [Ulvibacter antarcticus]RMA58909.1 hypothetical protein BXY75_2291 [Ulvibacter antarcticus]